MLTKFIFLQNDGFTTVVILSAGKKKKKGVLAIPQCWQL